MKFGLKLNNMGSRKLYGLGRLVDCIPVQSYNMYFNFMMVVDELLQQC